MDDLVNLLKSFPYIKECKNEKEWDLSVKPFMEE